MGACSRGRWKPTRSSWPARNGWSCWSAAPARRATGLGKYSARQIFNALRYGLRPSAATDIEIAADRGNFPSQPDYLGPGMPWVAWRHMSDQDLWAAIAYLRHGRRPVTNEVKASDAPPDKWAGEYAAEKIGPYPASPFPTKHERGQ